MAEQLQPCPAAFVAGLPAARACQLPGSGLPASGCTRRRVRLETKSPAAAEPGGASMGIEMEVPAGGNGHEVDGWWRRSVQRVCPALHAGRTPHHPGGAPPNGSAAVHH